LFCLADKDNYATITESCQKGPGTLRKAAGERWTKELLIAGIAKPSCCGEQYRRKMALMPTGGQQVKHEVLKVLLFRKVIALCLIFDQKRLIGLDPI
jgi:hypothetical protein